MIYSLEEMRKHVKKSFYYVSKAFADKKDNFGHDINKQSETSTTFYTLDLKHNKEYKMVVLNYRVQVWMCDINNEVLEDSRKKNWVKVGSDPIEEVFSHIKSYVDRGYINRIHYIDCLSRTYNIPKEEIDIESQRIGIDKDFKDLIEYCKKRNEK